MSLDRHHNAFLALLGLTLVRWKAGRAEFDLAVDHRHTNWQGVLQGGLLATMLDAACGYAGLAGVPGEADRQGVTLSLAVNYLGRVEVGAGGRRLRAVGEVTGGGRRIYFSHGTVLTEDGTVVATAQGSFKRLALR
ncbi:MAG TPA: PaaI family thioesterase [Azospirillum sp.]|nr:PaaI family thioesterase [Azospirillum sp.]